MYHALKYLALPPADFLLLLICGLALAFLGRRRLGLTLVTLGVCAGYLLATPYVAGELGKAIETIPATSADALATSGGQAIVILGAGLAPTAPEYGGPTVDYVALQRLRYGAHIWRSMKVPILVSGGRAPGFKSLAQLMKDALEQDFAVPVRWMEERSADTYENAAFSAVILKAHDIWRIVLVTDATHMARAQTQFEDAGIGVIPAPTSFSAPSRTFPDDYLPHLSGLQGSYFAIYELLAKAWYAARHERTPAPDAPFHIRDKCTSQCTN